MCTLLVAAHTPCASRSLAAAVAAVAAIVAATRHHAPNCRRNHDNDRIALHIADECDDERPKSSSRATSGGGSHCTRARRRLAPSSQIKNTTNINFFRFSRRQLALRSQTTKATNCKWRRARVLRDHAAKFATQSLDAHSLLGRARFSQRASSTFASKKFERLNRKHFCCSPFFFGENSRNLKTQKRARLPIANLKPQNARVFLLRCRCCSRSSDALDQTRRF